MSDDNDDLIRKIEALRRDMDSVLDSLNRPTASLRSDGMTAAFREQIGRSFLDQNRDAFKNALGRRDDMSSLSLEVISQLSGLYDNAIGHYEQDDINGGIVMLEELRALIMRSSGTVLSEDRTSTLMAVVDRAREQMALMETLRFQVGRPMLHRSCESVFGGMEPEEMEARLLPLSNAIRLKILAMLYTSPRSFTEMGKELKMQKGHLQFHLRKLIEAGYVKVDGRSHLYSIEKDGHFAIEGLGMLFSKLE